MSTIRPARPLSHEASALALLLIACGGGPAPTPDIPELPASGPVLTLERSVCFGFCPAYRLEITASGDGTIRATNTDFHRTFQVPLEQLRRTVTLIDSLGFFAADTDISGNSRLCGVMATDHPSSWIGVWTAKREHHVSYYHGCYGPESETGGAGDPERLPPELRRLRMVEDAIDSLGGVGQWEDSLRRR